MSSRVMTVSLNDVHLFGYHGVLDQEKIVGNDFSITINVNYLTKRIITDELDDTISYVDIYDVLTEEFFKPSDLLENLAGRIIDSIINKWRFIHSADVAITKLSPPIPNFCGSATVKLSIVNNN